MSNLRHRYRDALWNSDLRGSDLLVALALERFMNSTDLGGAWPSVETLAAMTGLSERTVQRSLQTLVALEWIRPVRPANQHRPTTYRGCHRVTPEKCPGVTKRAQG